MVKMYHKQIAKINVFKCASEVFRLTQKNFVQDSENSAFMEPLLADGGMKLSYLGGTLP